MIQYFATNRSLDDLGRATKDRDSRLKLSEGGYYFVDMAAYMAFYLGTTDAEILPEFAAIADSDKVVFDGFLQDQRIGRVVVCVHGFNVEMHEAFTWFRVLTDTMRHVAVRGERIVATPQDLAAKSLEKAKKGSLTAFIGFSWPSNGNVLSYPSDQREAVASAPAFASLLARIRAAGKRVSLVCHSMGNYMACHALAGMVNKVHMPPDVLKHKELEELITRAEVKAGTEMPDREDYFLDTFLMIAPDVERRHVTKGKIADPRAFVDVSREAAARTEYVGPFYAGLQHLARHKVNIYSRFDQALAVSDIEKRPRDLALSVGDTLSTVSLGLLDFLKRNPDQRWEKRLGSAPAPINAAPGFISVNATEIAGRKIDHSDHIDASPLAVRICEELEI